MPQPGTYALLWYVEQRTALTVGSLGRIALQPGHYVYVGSAFGPGGVLKRLLHHCRPSARPHWHVDYLKAVACLAEIWFSHEPTRQECRWASILAGMGEEAPCRGFGASDCPCATHLFTFPHQPSLATFRRKLRAGIEAHAPVLRLIPDPGAER